MKISQTQATDCLGCLDRFPGCHGSCEKYADYRRRLEAEKAEERKRYPLYASDTVERFEGGKKQRKKPGKQRARFKRYT